MFMIYNVFRLIACNLCLIRKMGLLTDFERQVLERSNRGLTDYRIAKQLSTDIPTVSRSRKNALRKIREAEEDLAWVKSIELQDFSVVPRKTVIKEEPELRQAF